MTHWPKRDTFSGSIVFKNGGACHVLPKRDTFVVVSKNFTVTKPKNVTRFWPNVTRFSPLYIPFTRISSHSLPQVAKLCPNFTRTLTYDFHNLPHQKPSSFHLQITKPTTKTNLIIINLSKLIIQTLISNLNFSFDLTLNLHHG